MDQANDSVIRIPVRRPLLATGTISLRAVALLGPLIVLLVALLLIPLVVLTAIGLRAPDGTLTLTHYMAIVTSPRYRSGLVTSLALATAVTLITVPGSFALAFTLERDAVPGAALVRAALTFPLSFPGIVVGFMTIILFGRTGIVPTLSTQLVGTPALQIAYTLSGLLLAYLYFEVPRVTLTLTEALAQVDQQYEAAARSLGARPWQVLLLVLLPLMRGPLIASAALAFATAMGAFGTAYTLAQRLTILPIQIYDAYTVSFDFELASAMAVVLGLITFGMLAVAELALATSSHTGRGEQ